MPKSCTHPEPCKTAWSPPASLSPRRFTLPWPALNAALTSTPRERRLVPAARDARINRFSPHHPLYAHYLERMDAVLATQRIRVVSDILASGRPAVCDGWNMPLPDDATNLIVSGLPMQGLNLRFQCASVGEARDLYQLITSQYADFKHTTV